MREEKFYRQLMIKMVNDEDADDNKNDGIMWQGKQWNCSNFSW